MRRLVFSTLLFTLLFSGSAWAQAPVITNFTTGVTGDNLYGPGTFLIVLGTFTTPSAGRDYTITVGGASSGINVAFNGVFIAAHIPITAAAGPTNLVITYQGQASNALPITIAALAPEIQGLSYTGGPQGAPQITSRPFLHNSTNQDVTPVSPAALNEVIEINSLTGLGSSVSPTVNPTVTVGGQNAQVLQVNPGTGMESIYFAVPGNAPLGVDPVVVSVNGVNSLPQSLPVGTAPAIASVLSAASFGSSATVAAGSIVALFGANFGSQSSLAPFPSTNVDGVSVLFGGTAAPIFALVGTSGQINVLVPSELPATGTVSVTVQTPTGASPPLTLTLAPATPGLFYYPDPLVLTRHNAVAVTAGTAWIAMPNSMAPSYGLPTNCNALGPATLCVQPAARGGFLQLYCTGLGKATPDADPNGAILPSGALAPIGGNPLYKTIATPTVTIGGQPATVLFSGIGPGFSGLYEVNVQIPTNIAAGNDVPLVISLNGASDSATIALQ